MLNTDLMKLPQHPNSINDIKGITKAQSLHTEAMDLGHNDLRRTPQVYVSLLEDEEIQVQITNPPCDPFQESIPFVDPVPDNHKEKS